MAMPDDNKINVPRPKGFEYWQPPNNGLPEKKFFEILNVMGETDEGKETP